MRVCRLAVGLVLTAALLTLSATRSAAAPVDRTGLVCALAGAGLVVYGVSNKTETHHVYGEGGRDYGPVTVSEDRSVGAAIAGGVLLVYAGVRALAHKGARTALAPNTQKEAVPGLILRVSPRDGETSVGWQWRF